MNVNQGDIFLVDLSPIKGHEQGGFRPVLVLQNDTLNSYLSTVVIAPITSNMKFEGVITTYPLKKEVSGLKMDSVALLHQVRTIDKSRLMKRVGSLSDQEFRQLRAKMMWVFYR